MRDLRFGLRTYVMGILNLTPDSFSGDGIYKDVGLAVAHAETMAGEGADIIDLGGESTRPGSAPVPVEDELERVIPVVKALSKKVDIPISIDTTKSEVARAALDNGASIINDITGLGSDPEMVHLAQRRAAKVVIMHIKGKPQTMQQDPHYSDLINEIIGKLSFLIKRAEDAGIKKEDIIIDPGIGFGKTLEHNLKILKMLSSFRVLQKPILIGPSRKSFIGSILGAGPRNRIFGTAASVAIAIQNGADVIRVHDVKEMKEVAMVCDAIVRPEGAIDV